MIYSTQVACVIRDMSKTAGCCMGTFSLYSISDMNFQGLFGMILDRIYSVCESVKNSRDSKKVSSTVSLRHSQRVLCDALTAVLGHLNCSYQARLDTCWLFCTLFHSCSVLREQGDVFHMRAHSDHVLVLMDKSTQSGDVLSHQLVGLVKNFIAVLLSEGVQQNT